MRAVVPAALMLGTAAAACGGSEARPAAPVAAEPPDRRPSAPALDDDDGVEVASSKGHSEPHQVEAGVRPQQRALTACYQDQLRTTRFLDGVVELGFVVGRDGAVTRVGVERGDLGSWAVERCMLEVGAQMRFAAPRGGGDADFTVPLELHSGKGRLVTWPEDQAAREVADKLVELDACDAAAAEAPANLAVTLYVGPRGQVRSVGFASPGRALDPAWAECAVGKVMAWKLTDPRGKIAKTGFRFRPE